MKRLLFAALFSSIALADVGSIVASSNNITTSFGSGAGSQILSGLANLSGLTVQNTTPTAIEVSWGLATCTSSMVAKMVVLPATANTHYFSLPVRGAICVRSTSGTISSGTVYAEGMK